MTLLQRVEKFSDTYPRLQRVLVGMLCLSIVSIVSFKVFASEDSLVQHRAVLGTEEAGALSIQETIQKIGVLMDLPTNEEPIVAVIQDPDALIADQAFYTGAEKGDKVVVYPKSKKAILYSERLEKILNAGPIYFPEKSETTGASLKIELEIRNGTATAGLANTTRDQLLKEDLNHFLTIFKTAPATNRYTKTLIVDLSKGAVPTESLDVLAKRVDGTITTTLPEGEADSEAQVLMILGK